ncbi:hypothetical protein BDZ97DRAFT_1824838 [Flammula alnicola]|nr:hypothetical protein BDZ97DRAFT_1824838 [Flammula alnicola]
MAAINDLPTELLLLIFNILYESCRDHVRPGYSVGKWNSDYLRNPSVFPLNTAWVCKFWRDVLMELPEYWTCIAFDVANDPTPLLNAFACSAANHGIHLLVFSSMSDRTEEGKRHENGRVESIVRHLRPHVEQYASIEFKVTFASSLPSPTLFLAREALYLDDLSLECQIHDVAHVGDNGKGARITRSLAPVMSGVAFMDILHLGDDWLATVKVGPYLTLYISDFQFQTMKPCPTDSSSTFDFMRLISALNPEGGIRLKNLSLSHRPHKRRDTEHLYDLYSSSISFDNVSMGFIMEFFQLATWSADYTTFSRCSIPPVSGSLSSYHLTIEHIPSCHTSHDDDSLYNIVSIWNNRGNLTVTSCASFDDKFLHWLGGEGEDGTIEAEGIMTLDVGDCTNFTAGALRRLIDNMNDPGKLELQELEGWIDGDRLEYVTVYGRAPALDDEDLEWFRSNGGETLIRWYVKGADGSEVPLEYRPASWG